MYKASPGSSSTSARGKVQQLPGAGLRVLGFGVWGVGFRVQGLGLSWGGGEGVGEGSIRVSRLGFSLSGEVGRSQHKTYKVSPRKAQALNPNFTLDPPQPIVAPLFSSKP